MEGVLTPPRRGLLARLRLWLAGTSHENDRSQPLEDAALALRRHGDAILRLAFSYLHRRDEAEDVLQDTLLQYLQKAPPFSSAEHEKAWLLRVAANLSKNRLSYWRRHPQEELRGLLPAEYEEPPAGGGLGQCEGPAAQVPGGGPSLLLRAVHHRGDRPAAGQKGVHRTLPAGPGPGDAPGNMGGG